MSSAVYTYPRGPAGPAGEQGPPGRQGNPGPVSSVGGIVPLGVSGSLTPIIGVQWTMQVALTGNATIQAPSVAYPGVTFFVQLIQDGTGGRTVSFVSFYRGLGLFTLNTTAHTQACLLFQVSADGSYALLLDVPSNGAPIA